MMNGGDIKKAAINKAKQVATAANNATNSNGGKKRRKGQDLKPIITTDGIQSAEPSPSNVNTSLLGYATLAPHKEKPDCHRNIANVFIAPKLQTRH